MPEPIKPILVSGPVARSLIGVGSTKYHELLKTSAIESVIVGGRRMILYSSLERLAHGIHKAAA